MKRMFLVLGSYLALVLIVCIVLAFALKGIPPLLPGDIVPYKIQRGIRLFLEFLPAICFSGFTIAGTISFAKDSEKCIEKFSPQMIVNFKTVIINALVVVFILAASKEIINPILQRKKVQYIETPALLNEYIEMGEQDFTEGKMLLAYGYAKQALKIDPHDERAKQLLDKAQGAIEVIGSSAPIPVFKAPTQIEHPRFSPKIPMTTFELLKVAKSAYDAKNYFDAHYYADLAVQSSTTKNINYETAKIIRSNAWNALNEPSPDADTIHHQLFRKKQEAYTLLMNGNSLESYYKFLELSKDTRLGAKDPDVMRYLAIAKENLDETYFFIEETEDMYRFETATNVYFKIPFENGAKSLFYIRGVTAVQETGGMVQYLRGLQVYSYDEKGEFLYSMSVPYAKMLVLDTTNLDSATKERFKIEKDLKQIPCLMLESISRTTNLSVIGPEYDVDATIENLVKVPFEIGSSFMIIPMPYVDFERICEASNGLKRMDLVSLYNFTKTAEKYGHSSEICRSTLVNRCSYPLEVLILMVFCAIIAWGYRLSSEQIFKFKYIIILPIASIVFFFALQFVQFIFDFLTLTMVVYCKDASLAVALFSWVFILIGLAFNFLGHKN